MSVRRQNCSPAASFTNCVMTLHLLKMHLLTFLSIPINKKFQILSFDTLVKNEQYNAVVCGSMTNARKKAIAHITTYSPFR